MTLVSRYIALRVFRGIALAFVIVTSIILLVDFVEATRNIGDDGTFSLIQIAGLTLLKIPQLIEETIPFIVLFGVMGALYGLNKRSELVVLRASGLSAWRFLWPAIWVSALIGIIWATVFNPLAAQSMAKYQAILIEAAQSDGAPSASITTIEDVWLREGLDGQQVVVHGKRSPSKPTTLTDATFYYYSVENSKDGNTSYSHRLDAKTAVLSSNGYWTLSNVTKNDRTNTSERSLTASLPTQLTLTDLREHRKSTRKAAFWNLPRKIDAAKNAGFSTVGFRLQWHKLLSLPLTLIGLTIVAAAVSMGNVRSGGVIRLMLAGAATGFFVYFFNNLISAFGQSQALSIVTASWTVPLLVLLLGLAYLARLEDG
jgi:lipopolysaccharide export system permease protein